MIFVMIELVYNLAIAAGEEIACGEWVSYFRGMLHIGLYSDSCFEFSRYFCASLPLLVG